jgi:hypothetical protein
VLLTKGMNGTLEGVCREVKPAIAERKGLTST